MAIRVWLVISLLNSLVAGFLAPTAKLLTTEFVDAPAEN